MFLVVSSTIPFLLMAPEAGSVYAAPSVISTITGFNGPFDLAHDPVNGRMYVTNFFGDNITVVDTDTNTIVGSPIPSGDDGPRRIAYDPEHQRMYVTNRNDATTVSVISTIPNTLLTNIPIGARSEGIAYNPDNQKMYVADIDGTDTVTIIDTDTNTVDGTVSLPVGGNPQGIAYDPDHQRMYVSRLASPGMVDIIDTTTNTLDTVHGPITVGNNPQFRIAYDPVHQTMYVENSGSGSVSVIDTDTGANPNTVIGTIGGIGSPRGIAMIL
jgi:YVTN family beta-propeller protein